MKKTLTLLSSLLISSGLLYADKPSWARNGGKPNSYEKQAHKDAMTQKSKLKKVNTKKKRKKAQPKIHIVMKNSTQTIKK